MNFAHAELDNMRDIVESFAKQVEGLRHTVEQRQSELNQARFEVEGTAATAEDARIIFERAKELRVVNVNAQRDVDNRFAEYQVARARLSEARSKVNQMIAAHAQAEADLARGLANLGAPGEANARLRRARSGTAAASSPRYGKGSKFPGLPDAVARVVIPRNLARTANLLGSAPLNVHGPLACAAFPFGRSGKSLFE